jgi:hypothetical protein
VGVTTATGLVIVSAESSLRLRFFCVGGGEIKPSFSFSVRSTLGLLHLVEFGAQLYSILPTTGHGFPLRLRTGSMGLIVHLWCLGYGHPRIQPISEQYRANRSFQSPCAHTPCYIFIPALPSSLESLPNVFIETPGYMHPRSRVQGGGAGWGS